MGTDIHIVIQRQTSEGFWEELQWQCLPWQDEKPVPGIPVAPRSFRSRCYNVFAILADVRNGHGFAGISTGERWPSISSRRGFPAGFVRTTVDPAYPEDGLRCMGDHSYTWVSLEEMKNFPWDDVRREMYGVISGAQFLERKSKAETGAPETYSQDVFGPGIKVCSAEEFTRLLESGGELAPHPYVSITWSNTAREATYDWAGEVIPWLEQLAAGRPLRLVLGFDS